MDLPVIVAMVIGVLAIGFVIALYNGIIGGYNRAQRAWADVLTYERQKAKVLDALQERVTSYKDYETRVMTDITRLRSAIDALPSQADGNALVGAERATKALMSGLRIAVEAYPDLKASEIMNNLMREIADQQENVGAAVVIFNREVEGFNNSIQMFPGSLVNSALNKKTLIRPFSDAEAEKGFDYKPNF
ncbi:LemA family protein [Stutzerimonas stutzeri]|uniref:LemA family protein n=1 Tax=Stutzerimonas stutzeri TaxID=316 RepID=UPI0015E2FEB8|nr:LemA family protein [Stutzerimonas stutzeri]MBA1280309.1 LemA family protein [Stutzerimonas stutzeri]